jgi:hypothetical protein
MHLPSTRLLPAVLTPAVMYPASRLWLRGRIWPALKGMALVCLHMLCTMALPDIETLLEDERLLAE